ncbi:MAG: type II toxin-antitoxin system Phd/YefM family antitoxin [Thiothrix sp.]|uniref:type II toxin-antitoxin system Phd/YefM family antitoxin n=1 Tax=Thiolinea disciformis TaxID=125614 RepID=UPI00036634A2|nr:type II toxin-antitoxin system Phd/YefM family antitoxin [Thiolinea disciformis]TXH70280.1 MAG: type II toxin-antitoxin system Phd/YefM family antitoxin [Thiothrix sp.]
MMQWRLADAKNRFSEVVKLALSQGPQQILRRNESVVILSLQDYQRLLGDRPNFRQFLLDSTPALDDLDLQRDRSAMREVDL